MQEEKRPFDLVVFGATGFTGRLAADYLSRYQKTGFRWAIAGRNRDRLDQIHAQLVASSLPPTGCFVVDHSDPKAVRRLVGKTRVALSFAGPFGRYGENIVAACAELGTHYLDITGETLWVRQMIEKYGEAAKKSGAVLIPFSGFDSVPSDLGVWNALELAGQKRPGKPITKVMGLFSVRGGINGGSFETMLDLLGLSESDNRKFHDPSLLVPDDCKERFKFPESRWPDRIKEKNITAPPFFMARINSRVVYRSQALRARELGDSQAPFEYVELLNLSPALSGLRSWGLALSAELFGRVGRLALARKLLRALGPKPGQGPSDESRESGFFRAGFFAYSGRELVSQCEMSYPGDPGNKATIVLICESALCFIFDGDRLPKRKGGFWTPSTALGDVLQKRLVSAGVQME